MREIWQQLEHWQQQGVAVALATVVRTWGSSPRQAGAKMIVNEKGAFAGSVSGGCVETAVIEEAGQVIQTGKPKLLSFGVSNETAWEVGLTCGGKIEVFVEKLPDLSTGFLADYQRATATNEPFVLGLVIRGDENGIGQRLMIRADGEASGKLRDHVDLGAVQQQARGLFELPGTAILEQGDQEIFLEACFPPAKLIIVGAAHVAIPLVTIAKALDYRVFLVDPRGAFATPERFPHADRVSTQWPDEALAEIGIDASTAVVVLTHDPKIDDPAVKTALQHAPAYLGVLGSKRTHRQRVERLKADGITDAQIARIHAPVGLDLGAKTPAEIAVSIMAEMIARRRQGNK